MKFLIALWALAALLVAASIATLWAYATLFADRIGVNSMDDKLWQLLSALYTTTVALFQAGLLVTLVALSTHAVFWARAEARAGTPE